ncbi:xaa-Pro aminopeptidase ApepP-like isoform X3 [Helicoverpa zea]|uniref:xaa-Pro aminopeptidase ApepP-like isoform X3 n=2 Tax=Helicoverpa zea TaxID=7113 RepID=UPI001F59B2D1|nr:xaa-Pro aminopeptidase ApepP-like isoform X3 [Helicoverpa zea]
MMCKKCVLILCLCILGVLSHFKTHEGSGGIKAFRKMSVQRLAALRALMASQPQPLAAYIIPTADAHNSEYIAPVDARREWISCFTGSAGTAVVTTSTALVWTDGRYYTQFQREADLAAWTLMKQSQTETPTLEKWLTSNLSEGAVVGVDPHTFTRDEWNPLQTALTKHNMQLIPVSLNLVDEVRRQLGDPPPKRPNNAIIPLPLEYTGKTAGEKIQELREKMAQKKASALVITALDEVAYTLNLRGSDIQYNPVFFSYLIITPTEVKLLTASDLSTAVREHLDREQVQLQRLPLSDVEPVLKGMAKKLSEEGNGKHSIWLSSDASEAIHRAAAGVDVLKTPLNLISEISPVALMKLIKNEVELQGFRECHKRDGIAVVRLLKWLHDQIDCGKTVTEIQAADKLLEFRKEESNFMGPSFETIPGAGPNGAIIHYSPSRDGVQKVIEKDDMFLLDSGSQYKDGTTDITRTRHMSRSPTSEQKSAFTRVLKGQIMVGSALFPQGVKGNVLDSFARHSLWEVGLDYAHGTGHGVGHFLNVHEGPSGVSWRPYPHDPGLKPAQILSNEPGYYKVGSFGIRHEDLVETIKVTKDSNHPRASGLQGDYDGRGVLGFHTLTLVPHQRDCIDVTMLTDFELTYLNAYHMRVFDTLGPILKQRGLNEDYKWLQQECDPMTRG